MTLLDAITLARSRPGTDTLAVFIRNTLGIDQPCGVEPFEVVGRRLGDWTAESDHRITVGDTNCLRQGQQLTSDEARGMARLLLIAADECDEANGR